MHMNLFDIKLKRQEVFEDGSLYLEFQPYNKELEDFIMYSELITNFSSVKEVLDNIIPTVRGIIFNSLPEDIQSKYVNTQFKLNNSIEDPTSTDYNILGFHKKRLIIKGELIKIDYYRNFNPLNNEYSDLVVSEERVFNRNQIGLVQYRQMNIKWYLKNGEIGCSKNTIKYYSPTESIDEGKNRRENIISEAKLCVLLSVGQSNGFLMLNQLKNQIELYIDGFRQPLIDDVYSIDLPFLNQEIKDNIVEILTF